MTPVRTRLGGVGKLVVSVVWTPSATSGSAAANIDLDIAAVLVRKDGVAHDAVHHARRQVTNGSIALTSEDSVASAGAAAAHEELQLDLALIPHDVRAVVIVVTSANRVPLTDVPGITVTSELQDSKVEFVEVSSAREMTPHATSGTGGPDRLPTILIAAVLERDYSDRGHWTFVATNSMVAGAQFVDALPAAMTFLSHVEGGTTPAGRGGYAFVAPPVKIPAGGSVQLPDVMSTSVIGDRTEGSGTLTAELSWTVRNPPTDVDLSCVALNSREKRVVARAFWGQMSVLDDAVQLLEDDSGAASTSGARSDTSREQLCVNLRRVPASVDALAFVVQNSDGGSLNNVDAVSFRLFWSASTGDRGDQQGRLVVCNESVASRRQSGFAPVALLRRGGGWDVVAIDCECGGATVMSGAVDGALIDAVSRGIRGEAVVPSGHPPAAPRELRSTPTSSGTSSSQPSRRPDSDPVLRPSTTSRQVSASSQRKFDATSVVLVGIIVAALAVLVNAL